LCMCIGGRFSSAAKPSGAAASNATADKLTSALNRRSIAILLAVIGLGATARRNAV
jgi:hypothetical protein